MNKNVIGMALAMVWWLASSPTQAQPSVYSGVYAYGEGGLATATDLQAITNFVSTAQKDVSILNNFNSWTFTASATNGTKTFPSAEMTNIRNHGSIPMFTWQPENGSLGIDQSFTLASITASNYDDYITAWAVAAKAWGYPFFLRFAHEMNGNWYPWAEGVNGNVSGQYVPMWRHVHDIFTSVGATNVTWVWCVNVVEPSSTPITELYPGDNYVDWLAVDAYNRLANPWQDLSTIAPTTVAELTSLAPGKPIMVAEAGCNQTNYPDETKAQWFLNALTNYLPVVQPRIKAWVYFNSTNTTDGNDWRIDVPPAAAAGYVQGIAPSYYDTNRYGGISASPIQPLLNDATTKDTMPPFVSFVSPATDQITNGMAVTFVVLASDKSGVSNVVFAVNGVAQQTNHLPPYQFAWTVPASGPVIYNVTAQAYDNAGNSAVSTVRLSLPASASTNILQTVDQTTGLDWNTNSWGTPASVPGNGSSYETPAAFSVRTPNTTTPAAFAGDSLQIDSGGTFYLKNGGQTSGNAANVNLLLNGGDMRFHGGFSVNGPAISGTIQMLDDSLMDTDQSPPNNGDICVQSALSGGGNLTVDMGGYTNALILTGNNSAYSGNWLNVSALGSIKLASGTTNALGSGTVTLVNPGSTLVFNSTNNLVVNNSISGPGSVMQENTNTVVLNAVDTFTGPLVISKGTLQLGAAGAISETAAIQLSSGAVLNVAAVPGGFEIGNSQTLAGIGSVSGNVTVLGTLSPGPLGHLNFSNSLVLSGTTIMELNRTNLPNADSISAATLSFGGALVVTNIGGALQAGDAFPLFSGASNGRFAATNLPALSSTNLYWDTSQLASRGVLAVASKTNAAPSILPLSWEGTNLLLQTSSPSGSEYILQATPQLAPANWVSVQTNAGSGLVTFTIPISAAQQKFFRICMP
jgi:autotransporter-associated beta strand protein